MSNPLRPLIMSIDDDQDMQRLIERILANGGYDVTMANSGASALLALKMNKPDLILLDVAMPGLDGYQVCSRLQEDKDAAYIPVIFVTALGEEQDKARAFSVGAVDYVQKPFEKNALLQKIRSHLRTNSRWRELRDEVVPSYDRIMPSDFLQFKQFLFDKFKLNLQENDKFSKVSPADIYSMSSGLGIGNKQMSQLIAGFLELSYVRLINPEDVLLGVLPLPFCRTNLVAAVADVSGENAFALSNPFNWELLEVLKRTPGRGKRSNLLVTEPENIMRLFQGGSVPTARPGRSTSSGVQGAGAAADLPARISDPGLERHPVLYPATNILETAVYEKKRPVLYIATNILETAVYERASDIHIEPKEIDTTIRFRIDGDMRQILTLKKDTAVSLISRFKALGGMDIADHRRPQDGVFETVIEGKTFKFRLATSTTPDGESLVIRLLEGSAKPMSLLEIGMTEAQGKTMVDFVNRTQGLILVVGPTGSGKTTTIYSLLSQVEPKSRSLMSVEDPVEYRLPFANQQQVNDKAGITFESLLKSSVRQDPDIFYLGEIRDSYSAKMSIDFASTGHLTITTLHTSNATSAIFRLQRLGVDRGSMSDSIVGVVAQRLIKKLCSHCKRIADASRKEIDMLAPFMPDPPKKVAHPVGCPECNGTGYFGREGIYEIISFYPEMSELIRSDKSIAEIRSFAWKRGDYLISQHAAEKVKNQLFSPEDIRETLVEDAGLLQEAAEENDLKITPFGERTDKTSSILVVEDDSDTQSLIKRLLENRGYEVTLAGDGIDALLHLGKKHFDLVLSDIMMPNLDGFKLVEMIAQKGLKIPVIFLTARTAPEWERKGFEVGAAAYLKKPIQKKTLLLRVEKVLKKSRPLAK